MRVGTIFVVLLPALVLAYPHPQRSSEGSTRGKQRFNAEELLVTAVDSETSWNPGRTGSIRRRSGYDTHEPEAASSVVAPVTQQFLFPRGSTRRGATLVAQATEDKPRSRSNLSRRGPGSQESVERASSSRRREHVVETVQVPTKSSLAEQPTFDSSKDNLPILSVEAASEPSTSPRSQPPPPPPPPAAIAVVPSVKSRRRSSFNRNSDVVHNEPPSRGTFTVQDAIPDRQSRFESSRRRQPSEVTQDTYVPDTKRNGRRNLVRGSSRGTDTDFSANFATNTQEIPTRSRNSGRRESATSRSSRGERPTNIPSSISASIPRSRNNPSAQSRSSKDSENLNNDIPVQEISEDSSVIASKRMDTNIDSSDEPKSIENAENISKESESSSTPAEESISSSSETPSTPETEITPKPVDVLQNNRRKSSFRSLSRDHGLNDRTQVSRSQSDSSKAGSNTGLRRGSPRSSRLNDNTPDYSTNSNVGLEESSDVNTLNYRRDFSVAATNNEQISQRSQSRRNLPSVRGRIEEVDSNVSGAFQRSTSRRNWEASKVNNEVNVDVGSSSTASSRIGNNRRSSASEGSRRTSGNERRGGRVSAVDVPGARAEEIPSRRGSRTRTTTTTKAEVNSVESVRPVARSGRRTPEADVASAAQRTSRRTSPDVGQRGGVKPQDVASLPTSGSADDAFVPKSSHKVVTVTAFTQQNDKAVDTEVDKEQIPNSLEDRKRASNKVSSKEETPSTSRKEKTRKVNLLLAPSPPSESAERGAKFQNNDIILPQNKFRSPSRTSNKNVDSNTESSRTSTRQKTPSSIESSSGSEPTSVRARGSFKTSRPRNLADAPDVSHQIASTVTPTQRTTTRTGPNFRHRFTQTSEATSGEFSTSTVRSGFIPRPRSSSYKSPSPLPTSDTSVRNTYSSKTRSTLSYRRGTTPSVLETTPLAIVQSSVAPSSPHRFSARYRNDLLRVTGALRVTTTPAYMPTVPTVSTTTSTTSTTEVPYVASGKVASSKRTDPRSSHANRL